MLGKNNNDIILTMPIFNETLNIKETINIYLSNPDQVLFNGKATGFTSFNEQGEFSIIANHTNFRSIISKHITITTPSGEKKTFEIDKGVLSFSKNNLEVYVV